MKKSIFFAWLALLAGCTPAEFRLPRVEIPAPLVEFAPAADAAVTVVEGDGLTVAEDGTITAESGRIVTVVGEGAEVAEVIESLGHLTAPVEEPATPAPELWGAVVDPCDRACRPNRLGSLVEVGISGGRVVLTEYRDDDGDGIVASYTELSNDSSVMRIVDATYGWRQRSGGLWDPLVTVYYVDAAGEARVESFNTRHLFGRAP